jgi:hypothetical protein
LLQQKELRYLVEMVELQEKEKEIFSNLFSFRKKVLTFKNRGKNDKF